MELEKDGVKIMNDYINERVSEVERLRLNMNKISPAAYLGFEDSVGDYQTVEELWEQITELREKKDDVCCGYCGVLTDTRSVNWFLKPVKAVICADCSLSLWPPN